MTAWLALPVVALLVALQTSLVPHLDVGVARPQLVLVWVVCWAAVRGRGEAIPWAMFGGVLLDLLSQLPPGTHLLALTLVAFLADFAHRAAHTSVVVLAPIAVAAGALLYGVILTFIVGVVGRRVDPSGFFIRDVLPSALYDLVVMVPMLAILRAFDRRFPASILPDW
jgi:rod shape-determining protein MreD